MPELPEVETVVRQLRSKVLNRTITHLEIIDDKVIDKKINSILPSKIFDIRRKGKLIIFKLKNDNNLVVQLRMTGHFYHVIDNNTNYQNYKKFLTGIFNLNDNSLLTYNTIRKFGKVELLNNKQLENKLNKLGPEPFEINSTDFVKLIKKISAAIGVTKLTDLTDAEQSYRDKMKKFAVLINDVKKGDTATDANIHYRRTSSPGITRMEFNELDKKVFAQNLNKGVVLSEDCFE